MTRINGISLAVLCLLAAGAAGADTPPVPVVYEDANVVVRAGIPAAGRTAIHLGDAFALVVEVEFDAGRVRVEAPDSEWFQRAMAGVEGLRLYAADEIAAESSRGGRVRVASRWRLQALDCPAGLPSCPGAKRYPLPVMTLAYELAGDGDSVDGRAARFRPWPGAVDVVPVIAAAPAPGSKLTDVLPGGAHAPVLDAGRPPQAAGWLVPAAALLLVLGYLAPATAGRPAPAARRAAHAETRWERVLAELSRADVDGERWADLLRRAVTWYCLDELGTNPCAWLGPAGAEGRPADPVLSRWHDYYLEVLLLADVAAGERDAWLGRFRALGGLQAEPAA